MQCYGIASSGRYWRGNREVPVPNLSLVSCDTDQAMIKSYNHSSISFPQQQKLLLDIRSVHFTTCKLKKKKKAAKMGSESLIHLSYFHPCITYNPSHSTLIKTNIYYMFKKLQNSSSLIKQRLYWTRWPLWSPLALEFYGFVKFILLQTVSLLNLY